MKNDKSQFAVRTADFYLSLFICHFGHLTEKSLAGCEGLSAWSYKSVFICGFVQTRIVNSLLQEALDLLSRGSGLFRHVRVRVRVGKIAQELHVRRQVEGPQLFDRIQPNLPVAIPRELTKTPREIGILRRGCEPAIERRGPQIGFPAGIGVGAKSRNKRRILQPGQPEQRAEANRAPIARISGELTKQEVFRTLRAHPAER